jgi:signal peptidase II
MATVETSPGMRNRFLYIIAPVLLLGLAADQASKSWASSRAAEPRLLVPGYLAAYSVENTGAIFGLRGDQAWTSTAFAMHGITCASILALVAYRDRRTWGRSDCLAGALVLAGIFGNTVDRIALGHVRDFLVTWAIPSLVFNVADLFVVVGCAALFMSRYLSQTRRQGLGGSLDYHSRDLRVVVPCVRGE